MDSLPLKVTCLLTGGKGKLSLQSRGIIEISDVSVSVPSTILHGLDSELTLKSFIYLLFIFSLNFVDILF